MMSCMMYIFSLNTQSKYKISSFSAPWELYKPLFGLIFLINFQFYILFILRLFGTILMLKNMQKCQTIMLKSIIIRIITYMIQHKNCLNVNYGRSIFLITWLRVTIYNRHLSTVGATQYFSIYIYIIVDTHTQREWSYLFVYLKVDESLISNIFSTHT